jgi:hypothetical protein
MSVSSGNVIVRSLKRKAVSATPTASLNLGFLTVVQEGSAYVGGYLVTNVWGRPLEFRLTSAVQPNRVQQVLYAATLVPYVCADLIGKTLLDKAGVAVQAVVTDREAVLDLRLKVDLPVVFLNAQQEGQDGSSPLCGHRRFPEDAAAVRSLLGAAGAELDLAEPFARIREAIAEARKMGVTGRAA